MVNRSGEEVAQKFVQQSAELTSSYNQINQSVKTDFSSISNGQKQFGEQLSNLNKNLAELNTSYESQLKGSLQRTKDSDQVFIGMEDMMKNLRSSVDETQKYREEIGKLSQNLSELNNIYGNMLSAMSIVTKK